MYLLVLRPLVKISLVSIILATMALSILFENLALLKWGGYGKSVPAFTGDKALFIGKVAIFPQSLWVIGLMIVVLIGLYLLTNRTRVGKQMTATANDPGAASLSGVNTGRMILLAFAISAAIGALGGIAITPINSTSYLSGGIYALSAASWPPSWAAGARAAGRWWAASLWASSSRSPPASCPPAIRTPSPTPSSSWSCTSGRAACSVSPRARVRR